MADAFTTTGSGLGTNLVTLAYDKLIETNLRVLPKFREIADKKVGSLTHNGSSIRFQFNTDIAETSVASATLEETVDTDSVALPATSYIDIIAGNIATGKAAEALQDWGADGLRVGIGGGSLCTTRIKTGFGVPNVTSLEDCAKVVSVPVLACGGIRSSGDIAKALGVGASSVILGSLLAGTKEAPGAIIEKSNGLYKRYRGAASLETKSVHNQAKRNVEGESTVIPFKGGVKFIVEGLTDGLRSALSYAGARNLEEFIPEYVVVTNAGMAEAKPHLL